MFLEVVDVKCYSPRLLCTNAFHAHNSVLHDFTSGIKRAWAVVQVFESGGANDVFLLEITSIAHFCHAGPVI